MKFSKYERGPSGELLKITTIRHPAREEITVQTVLDAPELELAADPVRESGLNKALAVMAQQRSGGPRPLGNF